MRQAGSAERVDEPEVLDELKRDAMPSGGRLTLGTEIKLIGGEQGAVPMVALAVADTGVGMDADTLNRVFEPFFTTKQEKGSGLGLSTVHSIVQGAGGRLDVSSTVGKGTVITVLLPSHQGGPSTEAPTEPASALPLQGSEIVLVFIQKPLSPDRLLRVVRAAIDMVGESGSEPASH